MVRRLSGESAAYSRNRIEDDANFAGFGLDSAESVFMVTALEDWLGLELSPKL